MSIQKLEKWVLHDFKCKLRSKYSENTPKLTVALSSFCHIASLQVGYGWAGKPSKHAYGFRYDIRHITKAEAMVIA